MLSSAPTQSLPGTHACSQTPTAAPSPETAHFRPVAGKLCPLEYYSATHTDQAKRYGSSERECLAIIKSIEHFAPLVNGSRFKCRLYTDHAPLTSLTNPARTMNSVRLAARQASKQRRAGGRRAG